MTEEDQLLVAHAALHGARFVRIRMLWGIQQSPFISKWSIGRAAARYLYDHGLMTPEAWANYERRTDFGVPQEASVPDLLPEIQT